jgi:hypothetical protein
MIWIIIIAIILCPVSYRVDAIYPILALQDSTVHSLIAYAMKVRVVTYVISCMLVHSIMVVYIPSSMTFQTQ